MSGRLTRRRHRVGTFTPATPVPPNPGFRQNRGGVGTDQPVYGTNAAPSSYAESYNTSGFDATLQAAVDSWIAAGRSGGVTIALTSVGWAPEPILDDGSIPLAAVALVNVKGELTNQYSDKQYALKAGAPIPSTFVPYTTSDHPAAIYSPNYSIFDAGAGRTLHRRVWDIWRLSHAGYTWDNATSRTADVAVTSVVTTAGSTSISFPSGMIQQASHSGMTLVMAGVLPANTYIISTGTTTGKISQPALTGTGSGGAAGTLTPTDPRNVGWPVWECQNAARSLDLDNNPSWPKDRYKGQGATQPDLVENAVWAATATRKGYLGGMLLGEDVDMYIQSGRTKIPVHTVDLALPNTPGVMNGSNFVWPAQATDTGIAPDPTAPFMEGNRWRADFGFGEAPAQSMPLTDAYINSLNLHVIAELVLKMWCRAGGMMWDRTGPGYLTIRWDSKLAQFFGGTPQYAIMNGIPMANVFRMTKVGSDTNWNP